MIRYVLLFHLKGCVASPLFRWWQVDKPDVPDWQQWDTGESLARAWNEDETAHMQAAYDSMLQDLPPAFPLTFNEFEFLVDGAVDLAVDVLQRIYRDDPEFQKLCKLQVQNLKSLQICVAMDTPFAGTCSALRPDSTMKLLHV
eukprot:Protomagalhaensia_wolfi_Nauph_80__19@NODE_1012_length_1811_cov_32_533296_g765_i0_p1_GENE_NODE_1012_length_1811_cov_32_533296_g765_i0NODE_1012_length_1811_cov_32_533296_g765_i0_p1_ORF_typecomplete_len156_score13_29_NODE_1012_length_1811_cov_32_533296_g765_i013441772